MAHVTHPSAPSVAETMGGPHPRAGRFAIYSVLWMWFWERTGYYGMRSFIYSLGILPFHWNMTVWPVIALQALLVAWLLWLTVR